MHGFKLDYLLIEVFPLCLKALLELKDLILYALLAGHDTLTIITDISLILVDLICVHAWCPAQVIDIILNLGNSFWNSIDLYAEFIECNVVGLGANDAL